MKSLLFVGLPPNFIVTMVAAAASVPFSSTATKDFTIQKLPQDLAPLPAEVEVFQWHPTEPPDEEAQREIELSLQDAEKAKSKGDLRAATAHYAQAFRWGGRQDMAVALKQHECWRQLGSDNAEKSAIYLLEKIIPMNPHDPRLWIAAAESSLASGGDKAKARAAQSLHMALILDPDNERAAVLLAEARKKGDEVLA